MSEIEHNWFVSIWIKLNEFWRDNLAENYKQVSISFGVMLVIILASLIPPVSALMQGGEADWGTFGVTSFVAFIQFVTFLVYSFFGKKPEVKNVVTNTEEQI
jgi:hypothetical protein